MRGGRKGIELIFGRGGVRGIALAGAVAGFEERGYRIGRTAGTSAGAMVAALVAAGYGANEIRQIVWQFDYPGMCDARGRGRLPGAGPILALLTTMGMYRGDVLLETFRELLAVRGIRTFGDLRCDDPRSGFRLRVVATDLTRRRTIVLPDDAPDYGVAAADLEVAAALRMSASVPFVFEPVRFGNGDQASLIVDGGLLAGIPFGLLDEGRDPDTPVFGVHTRKGTREIGDGRGVGGAWSFLQAAFYTTVAINDRSARDARRTVEIDCGPIRCIDFGLDDAQKAMLYGVGLKAARGFLSDRDAVAGSGLDSTARLVGQPA